MVFDTWRRILHLHFLWHLQQLLMCMKKQQIGATHLHLDLYRTLLLLCTTLLLGDTIPLHKLVEIIVNRLCATKIASSEVQTVVLLPQPAVAAPPSRGSGAGRYGSIARVAGLHLPSPPLQSS